MDTITLCGRQFPIGVVIKANQKMADEAIALGLKPMPVSPGWYDIHTGIDICHAPPASDDRKKSESSGKEPKSEPSDSEDLTLRQHNSVKLIQEMIQIQAVQINELTKGVEYLAQQVKTLVDALAEDQDPDAPLTHYMSGKPI